MAKNRPRIQFRPSDGPGFKFNRQNPNWRGSRRNFRAFSQYEHDGPFNEQVIVRMFRRIHYLTSHAPKAVTIKHKALALRWDRRLDRKASIKYVNRYSLHRFL